MMVGSGESASYKTMAGYAASHNLSLARTLATGNRAIHQCRIDYNGANAVHADAWLVLSCVHHKICTRLDVQKSSVDWRLIPL